MAKHPASCGQSRPTGTSSVSFAFPTLRSVSISKPATSTVSFSAVSIEIQLSGPTPPRRFSRSDAHTSELQSLMRISYPVFCFKHHHTTNNKPQPIYLQQLAHK